MKSTNKWSREAERLEQTRQSLYRVLPKDYFTRDEFALAVSLPAAVPTVRDCLVQFGDDVFVFDLTNTIIGVYPKGSNPFVPVWSEDPKFKCDRNLLDAQTKRRIGGAAEWTKGMAAARNYVLNQLKADDSVWSKPQPISGLQQQLQRFERALIIEELRRHRGDQPATAAALGIAPHTLQDKLRKLAVVAEEFK